MRLVDADDVVELIQARYECPEICKREIDAIPTIDPVRHGKWICHPDPNKMALVCSVCGQVMPFVPEYLPEEPPYCNCGARMDGEV